ncbi:MAG: hypothetical protein R2865_12060 [Deinococcales bacterium]
MAQSFWLDREEIAKNQPDADMELYVSLPFCLPTDPGHCSCAFSL